MAAFAKIEVETWVTLETFAMSNMTSVASFSSGNLGKQFPTTLGKDDIAYPMQVTT